MQGVTLDTIGSGALSELFDAELARVLANIADPNTDEKAKRTISITVSFKPSGQRDSAAVELTCASKLAGIQKVATQVFMGKHLGKLIAVENDPRQSGLFDEAKSPLTAVASFSQREAE
jgi:hypothetical protein